VAVCQEEPPAERTRILVLAEAREDLFAGEEGEPNLSPRAGQVAVVCRFDAAEFRIRSLDQVAVLAPSGEAVPLIVESASVWEEMGFIVSVRLAFFVDEGDADCRTPLRIVWGPGVKGEFTEIEALRPDASARKRIRSATWALPEDTAGDDSSIASVEIVADSKADYDSLYYLLPMALLFVLLTVRKIKARDGGSSLPA
jgi:hypothetical protein